ncbi:MAG: hypothetical protein HND44_01025 [Chloroflexi bacterium]|nr:hypothetical protein [Ardenticatenaceae bacterium]MBL1127082.1 hypothetical protein [Chloroflexota bacterium]NOG33143.1 hypothetical protein [Chloroflexota bacterium]
MDYKVKTYTVRLRERGQLTLPQPVRERLVEDTGNLDLLTLVQIDDMLILTPKKLYVTELAKQISAEMERTGVALADLLEGLAQEREAIWHERLAGEGLADEGLAEAVGE